MSDDSKVLAYFVGMAVMSPEPSRSASGLCLWAPCGWFMYGAVKDMPARCVGELVIPGAPAPGKPEEKPR